MSDFWNFTFGKEIDARKSGDQTCWEIWAVGCVTKPPYPVVYI